MDFKFQIKPVLFTCYLIISEKFDIHVSLNSFSPNTACFCRCSAMFAESDACVCLKVKEDKYATAYL